MSADVTLAAMSFDAAASGVAGVEALYAARPLAARVVGRMTDDPQPHAYVQTGADGVDVTVSIGVDARLDSADVADRVAAGLRGAPSSVPLQRVRVRVSRLVCGTGTTTP